MPNHLAGLMPTMDRKKVLILAYYWPPSGGAGVQRWWRFVKNLRAFGWEPTIYTAKDANYAVYDENLADGIPEEVKTLRLEVPEPNNIIPKLLFWKKDKNGALFHTQQQGAGDKSYLKKLLWWIRGNFFIPDARFLWIKPSIKFLNEHMRQEKYDAVVSTGPPHSMHMIGAGITKDNSLPWLADFRDPWMSMDYLRAAGLTKFAYKKHQQMEKQVITGADKVVVVGKAMSMEFEESYGVKSEVIHNGYNSLSSNDGEVQLDEKFTIVHIGSLSVKRNCPDLWEALSRIASSNEAFRESLEIKLIGKVSPNVIESIRAHDLESNLNLLNYIPYQETLIHSRSAQILLLPIDRMDNAEFVITGKIFEYLNSRRPILMIGPTHGDAAAIIKDCQSGESCDFDDVQAIEKAVLHRFNLYQEKKNDINPINIENYSAFELTRKLAGALDKITETN